MPQINSKVFNNFKGGWNTQQNEANQSPQSLNWVENLYFTQDFSLRKRFGTHDLFDSDENTQESRSSHLFQSKSGGKEQVLWQNGDDLRRYSVKEDSDENIGLLRNRFRHDFTQFGGKAIMGNEFSKPKKYWYLRNPIEPILSTASSGSLSSRTYHVRIAYETSNGKTKASVDSQIEVPSNEVLVVKSPVDQDGTTGYSVYVSEIPGDENLQEEDIDIGTDWQEPDAGINDTQNSDYPTENTAWVFNDLTNTNGEVSPPKAKIWHTHNQRVIAAGLEEEPMTLYYSALQNDSSWHDQYNPSNSGGSAEPGIFNFSRIIGQGEEIKALETLQDRLIVFFVNTVVVLSFPEDATQLSVDQVMEGKGCVSSQAVVSIGGDVLWLSKNGVESLSQNFGVENLSISDENPSEPIDNELSKKVENSIEDGTTDYIDAIYYPPENWVIWSIPESGQENGVSSMRLYIFDLDFATWSFFSGFVVNSLTIDSSNDLYGTKKVGNILKIFDDTFDDNGEPIKTRFSTSWVYLDGINVVKKGKWCYAPVITESDQTVKIRYGWDFDMEPQIIETETIPPRETSDWGEAEWGESAFMERKTTPNRIPIRGRGTAFRLSFEEESTFDVVYPWFRVDYTTSGQKKVV